MALSLRKIVKGIAVFVIAIIGFFVFLIIYHVIFVDITEESIKDAVQIESRAKEAKAAQ